MQIGVCERCAAGMRVRLIQVARHRDVYQPAATAHELTLRTESEKFKYLHKFVSSFELPGKLNAKQHKGNTVSHNFIKLQILLFATYFGLWKSHRQAIKNTL
jgi:hypothetical protein